MGKEASIGQLVGEIREDVQNLVRQEIELAKAELTPQVKQLGAGVGMFGAAGYLAVTASLLLFFAASVGLGAGFAAWFGLSALGAAALGFLTVAVLVLIVVAILIVFGIAKMKFEKPERTISSVEQTVAALHPGKEEE
ncbi:MAG: phage holin family protein [Propionibacteriaceae bacterium]|jgi:hypothetical protein|nr:phage holin family protein [Propionibacteriaceae bacterium]